MTTAGDDARVCSVCSVYVPKGQVLLEDEHGSGRRFCEACARAPAPKPRTWIDFILDGPTPPPDEANQRRSFDEEVPHLGIACFVGLLVAVGFCCLIGAFIQKDVVGGTPIFYLLAAITWFALAVGLHLLRRILIAVEIFSEKKGRT